MTKNKYEIAEYLANLMSVDAYHDDLGITNKWLNEEMSRMSKVLRDLIEEENQENETRPKPYNPRGSEEGAHTPQSQSRGSEPTRNGNGDKTEHGKGLRR